MAVNQKRVDEVMSEWIKSSLMHKDWIATLPEFQTPEWIKCSERMPEQDQLIFWTEPPFKNVYTTDYTHDFLEKCDYWCPVCHVPAPPVEEESLCVKELRVIEGEYALQSNFAKDAVLKAIAIVKKHEKAGK